MLSLKRHFVFLLMASCMFAMAGSALAAEAEIPEDVQLLKQFRTAQNQLHLKEYVQSKASSHQPDEEQTGLLNRLDAKQARDAIPTLDLNRSRGFHLNVEEHGGSYDQTRDLREVIYGSGRLHMGYPDSVFFNFLTGANGADTLGMDVRIIGNEGAHIGNEGTPNFGTDYSPLLYLAESGTLADFPSVPTIDDPDFNWVETTYDFQYGTGGLFLPVGSVWAVYTRTEAMYVVLEVTGVDSDWSNGWINFDYKIQTDGSALFDGEVPAVDITVNGLQGDTLDIGSEPYVQIDLGAEDLGGYFYVVWDGDHDGALGEADVWLEEYEFFDNDIHDVDPTAGIFAFTYDNEMADGINYVSDDFLFVAETDYDFDVAPVSFESIEYPYSVTGTVTEQTSGLPLAGITVWIDYAWYDDGEPREEGGPIVIDVTDAAGGYELMVPDSMWYIVGSFDHLMQTEGLMPEPFDHEVYVDGDITGVNFTYRQPLTEITGTVTDELGNPIPDVGIEVEGDMFEIIVYTDELGQYVVGVDPGEFWLEIEPESIMPDYMAPPEDVYIVAGDLIPNIVDFTLLSTSATISGTVYLDDVPFPYAWVFAWNEEVGHNVVTTEMDGSYVLPVYTPLIEIYYYVGVHIEDMEGIVQVSDNHDVMPGAVGEDIYLETVTGGLYGTFYNAENGEPILWDDHLGISAQSTDDPDQHFHTNPDPETGEYTLWLPPGTYEVHAGGEWWMGTGTDTFTVASELILHDVYLTPWGGVDAVLEGQVLANFLREGIGGAHVEIGNEYWGEYQMADEEGYFHFDLPYGHYGLHVYAEGFFDWWGEIDVFNEYEYTEIYLDPIPIEGVIRGTVTDMNTGNPIPYVDLGFGQHEPPHMGFHAMSGEDGYYQIDVMNGSYFAFAHHPDYLDYFEHEGPIVMDDTATFDIALVMADGSISGQVTDADTGMPIPWIGVGVMDNDNPDMWFFGGTDEEGFYHINVLNGTYTLFIDEWGYEPYMSGPIYVQNDHPIHDVQLIYMPYAWPPIVNFVVDQWNDQGRWIRTQFDPGGTQDGPFMGWSVWRLSPRPDGGDRWDFITYVPHQDRPHYNLVVPTLVDSNAATTPDESYWTGIVITGHRDMWEWLNSEPGWGYSIDNIHPMAPAGLLIEDSGEDFVNLSWAASPDEDFMQFRLFRSLTDDFTGVDPLNIQIENGYVDENVEVGNTYYYMVRAVDANGNLSGPSEVVSTTIVSIDDDRGIPTDFVLEQNYPNPFNPSTQITFGLPSTSHVVLEVYNLLGQKVRVLVSETLPAGYITTSWDGLDQNGDQVSSGTYIYRMRTPTNISSQKMLLMR